jgi:hypothetical protein
MSTHRKIQVLHYFLNRSIGAYVKVIRGGIYFHGVRTRWCHVTKRWKVCSQINPGWGNCATRLHFLSKFHSIYLNVSTFLVHTASSRKIVRRLRHADSNSDYRLFGSPCLSAWKPAIYVGLLRNIPTLVKIETIWLALHTKVCLRVL